MSEKNDGGSAFPVYAGASEMAYPGMTLRDYFAASAMQSLSPERGNPEDLKANAIIAYDIADAMLVEREKEQPGGPVLNS